MNAVVPAGRTGLAYTVGVLGALLIVAVLVWLMHRYTQPAPLGEDRAAVRAKALAEIRATEAEALNTAGWIDKNKGLVHLPIAQAMNVIERNWARDPAAGRSNLIERVEKATAPAPKAPEKPSQFE